MVEEYTEEQIEEMERVVEAAKAKKKEEYKQHKERLISERDITTAVIKHIQAYRRLKVGDKIKANVLKEIDKMLTGETPVPNAIQAKKKDESKEPAKEGTEPAPENN